MGHKTLTWELALKIPSASNDHITIYVKKIAYNFLTFLTLALVFWK